MKIVDRVIAGGISFHVRHCDDIPHEEGKPELWGDTDWEVCEIKIKKGLVADRVAAVLMHEITHIALDMVSEERDEPYVERLSSALYAILTDSGLLAEE